MMEFFHQRTGDVLGSFALDPDSVSEADVYDAVWSSLIATRTTLDGVLSPDNHRIVELFITP